MNELNVTKHLGRDLTNGRVAIEVRGRADAASSAGLGFNAAVAHSDCRCPFLLRSVSQLSIISPKRHLEEQGGKKKKKLA